MEKLYEDDSSLAVSESARDGDASEAETAPAVQAQERALPAGVLLFDAQRYRRPAGALQTKTARLIIALAESFAIVTASVITGVAYHGVALGSLGNPVALLAVGLLATFFFRSGMSVIETNQRFRRLDGPEAMRDVTLVWLGAILCVTFFAFSLKAGADLSRGSMLAFMVLGHFGIVAIRVSVPRLLVKHYRPGRLVAHQIIVVGADGDPTLETLRSELSGAGYAEPRIVRFNAKCGAREWQRELQNSMARVLRLARTTVDGEICIAAGGFDDQRLREIATALQVVPRAVRIIPAAPLEQLLHLPIRAIGSLHSVELQKAPMNAFERAAKRAIDVVLASAALIALAPFFALLALAIRLSSRGPAFFRQTRLGHRSVPFDIFKFRTMTVAENGAEVKQAQANDRRVTWLGRWLRKTSIDELPQLINVIKGEMSLVGPRPHAVAHDKYYATLIDNYDIRQHVKPGITGWAQVRGLRGETASPDLMRKRVEADIWYAKNAGILTDLRILMLTVVEVLRQRNAH
jgi:Undecaprenyl-phosphate glucose phosphotransferase